MNEQPTAEPKTLSIPAGHVTLAGDLAIPADARGIVLFAHGSGSSRRSPRNRFVAGQLREAGIATLLMDLLTAGEEQEDLRTRALRFDIPLLADRVLAATDWLAGAPAAQGLRLGYFGASTGAAAALVAAADRVEQVAAVVSRGGRPDLAGGALGRVRAPTRLIVGGSDPVVLDLNRRGMEEMSAEHDLVVVPGATHLFEEPGALEQVARLACEWFARHFLGAAAE